MSQALRSSIAARQQNQQQGDAPAKKVDPLTKLMEMLKPQLATALPRHMTADRMARVMLTELRMNEKLAEAALQNPMSFFGAMLRASQLGLEVGNGLGHCYLLPFKRNKKVDGRWTEMPAETQLIIGYKGMIDLARRSGQIENIYACEVYAGEKFEVPLGLNPDIIHVRSMDVDDASSNIVAIYAVAKLKGGGVQFEVMRRSQIEAIRERSKSKSDGPWVTDWAEMGKKTVVRRLFKFLPVSIEIIDTTGDVTVTSLDGADNFASFGNVFEVDKATGEVTQPPSQPQAEQQLTSQTAEVVQPVFVAPEREPVEQSRRQEQHEPRQREQQQSQETTTPLSRVLAAFEVAQSVEALDELLIRAEGDLEGVELEKANRAYRNRKTQLSEAGLFD